MSCDTTDNHNTNKNNDCYFYYYSTCSKGDSCPYRHEPAALKNETICLYWRKGFCNKEVCTYRHMNITKDRSKIPCFFENEEDGCKKTHCPFLHRNRSHSINASKNRSECESANNLLSHAQKDWEGDIYDPMESFLSKISKTKSNAAKKEFKKGNHGNDRQNQGATCLWPPRNESQYSGKRHCAARNFGYSREYPVSLFANSYDAQHSPIMENCRMRNKEIRSGGVRSRLSFTTGTRNKVQNFKHSVKGDNNIKGSKHNNSFSKTSIKQLIISLMKFPSLTASLSHLASRFNFNPEEVNRVITSNPNLFISEGGIIQFKVKLTLCKHHLSSQGCVSFSKCIDLHVCPKFIAGGFCDETKCNYGHFWYSDHNIKCLKAYKLENMSNSNLKLIFNELLFSRKNNSLKICEEYVKEKCFKGENCNEVHFCVKNLAGTCLDNSRCSLNHSLTDGILNFRLACAGISMNESPRDIIRNFSQLPAIRSQIDSLKKSTADLDPVKGESSNGNEKSAKLPKTVWSYELNGEVPIHEICYKSVESLCEFESSGCKLLHCAFHFHWQIKSLAPEFNYWVNLTTDLVLALEKAFCNPSTDKFLLPVLDSTSLPHICKGLFVLLKGKTRWEADFKAMELNEVSTQTGNSNVQLKLGKLSLRRLCTEYPKDGQQKPFASVFNWYFLDKCNNWIEYGQDDSNKNENTRCKTTSSDIESAYQLSEFVDSPYIIQSTKFKYSLDFDTMQQTNMTTKVQRLMKRRPMPHLKEERTDCESNSDLPSTWDPMKSTERCKRVNVSSSSEEYKKVVSFIQEDQNWRSQQIIQIERVQNAPHYRIFQQKVREMTSIYGDPKIVDIRSLFHGTRPDCVQPICEQNFDWRLHGSSTGQAYGQGAYFSPSASVSLRYCKTDTSGKRFLLISKVAVGTTTLGSSIMARPPMNATYKVPFDSTVDRIQNPSIIVKYDKAEYYPIYVVTLQ